MRFPNSNHSWRGRLAGCGFVLVLVCAGWQVAVAEPVTLHLRNGDRLTGELLSMSTTNFVLTNGLLGRLSVPVPSVERMERIGATNVPAVVTNTVPQTLVTATPPPAPAPTNQVAAATTPAVPAKANTTVTNAPSLPKAPVAAAAPPPKP